MILGSLMLAMLLAALDQTIVSTALPTIASELGGLEHLSWVVTAYLLASTVATPLWGKLGDMYGRKRFFQAAIVIFLIGSALCGIAGSMPELIAFRALQGLGGGGLMVLTQAIIGDVVPPRDRGRYQGLFGAVFGVSSVLGPLLGGLFVDHLSWRWVFYVNLPLGAAALLAIAVVLSPRGGPVRHRIDYAGTVLLAAIATCLVLVASLGGSTWAWGSAQVVGLLVLAALLTAVFVPVERRAPEPVLPLKMFRLRVFTVCALISFVVGFAMFGALTFIPTFLQVVDGVSPTMSGVHMLPMVLGMLLTSIGSGQIISRTGRYRLFPIIGTAVTAGALLLLSTMDETTGAWTRSLYFLALGLGLGLVMQVLVVAVQNVVDYRDLGTATSGVTFFRSIGASFGTAVFGAIFASRLTDHLADALRGVVLPPGFDPSAAQSDPRLSEALPPAVQRDFLHAYAESIGNVFLYAVPVALAAFLLSWLLKEVPLRSGIETTDIGETVPPGPTQRSSAEELARGLSELASHRAGRELYRAMVRRAGLDVDTGAAWMLFRLRRMGRASPAELVWGRRWSEAETDNFAAQLAALDLVRLDDGALVCTPEGELACERLIEARREVLAEALREWDADADPEFHRLLVSINRSSAGCDREHPMYDLAEPRGPRHARR
nr:MDR family MFS transporter [Allostreptomyces psammosilenae]